MEKLRAYFKKADGTLTPLKAYFHQALRPVRVGDTLGEVTWADTPQGFPYISPPTPENQVRYKQTLLEFDDGTKLYTEKEYNLVMYYRVRFEEQILANAFGAPPTSWINPSFDFGGRTVTWRDSVFSWDYAIKVGGTTTPVTPYYSHAPTITINPIYGVSGLYQSDPALTRTDDAVGMGFAINSSTGAISSDFNDVFPWSEATVETIDGNVFLHMPEMWFRVGWDSSLRITDIAVSKQASGAGNWYKVESFYYSCYGGSVSSGKLSSVSGVSRQAMLTRAQFRTAAAANGSGYFQRDLYHSTVMSFLWWIEWATKDSASIMIGRIAFQSVTSTGNTNSVPTPSGFRTNSNQMRYHYIEDFIGNLREWVDGVVGSGNNYYVTASPANFSDVITGYTNLPYNYPSNASSSNRCISAFGWDIDNPFLCQPIEQTGTDYTIHFCDANTAANNVSVSCGAYYNITGAEYGLSYFSRAAASSNASNGGSRLLYKPTGG